MEANQKRRKLRVLCLHGYRQNATTFREKTGALRKAMKSRLEFEFLSAPLTPNLEDRPTVDSDTTNFDDNSAKAWWFSKEPATFPPKMSHRSLLDLTNH
uniref:Serine hydrolase FSH domain-containing protein n=1 Tax=Ditylenchus dipsaci TaxID=166011 RepID=A0A915CYH0_9BILA